MLELSPLPAIHSNYSAGGSKYIKISHRGSVYELTSDFTKGNSHSFIKDGVDLNTGTGNYTTQLQLVKEHFGITPAIHELALGIKKFHQMSVAERRQWFTQLSDTNYDYAVSVYNRLKEKQRDAVGALKLAKKKLDIENVKVFDPQELKRLDEKCTKIYEFLSFLQEYRKPVEQSTDEISDTLERMQVKLADLAANSALPLKRLKSSSFDVTNLGDLLEQLNNKQASNKALSDSYYQDFEQIDKQYKLANSLKEHSIAELRQVISNIEKQIEDINSSFILKLDIQGDVGTLYKQANFALEKIESHIPILSENAHHGFNHDWLKHLTNEHESNLNRLKNNEIKTDRVKAVVEHYEALRDDKKITCPNCNHQWILGFDEAKYTTAKQTLLKLAEDAEKLNKAIKEEQDLITLMSNYLSNFDDVLKLFEYTSSLEVLWDIVGQEDMLVKDPANIPFMIEQFIKDLDAYKKSSELWSELSKKKLMLEQLNTNNSLDFDYISSKRNALEEKISQISIDLKEGSDMISEVKKLIAARDELDRLNTAITELLDKRDEKVESLVESYRRSTYNDLIRAVQSLLTTLETQQHAAVSHNSLIATIEAQIKEFERSSELISIALKELSPTEGLIAEGLFGFMKLFIDQLNQVIKKIWSYPLIVTPCSLDKNGELDLDYKFPVIVDTADNVRKDVSEGSSAMHEVINLAFKITAFKALGLEDYPLYLDEFGSTMDPMHKAATITLINTIMEQEHFPQLFMISHDAVQYGALSNTEVTMLSRQNMSVPEGSVFNQAVTIN